MCVGVDEAGRDDLVRRIDHLVGLAFECSAADMDDPVVFDNDRAILEVPVAAMLKCDDVTCADDLPDHSSTSFDVTERAPRQKTRSRFCRLRQASAPFSLALPRRRRAPSWRSQTSR